MSTKFGPGFPGNTKASSATDTPLPSKPNEGDPCMNMPKDPIKTGNSHNAGTTAGVQSQAAVNKPRGTRGSGTTANAAPIGK